MIYLDCAATAMQKPPAVPRVMAWAATHLASPGRGGHRPAMRAGELAFDCRKEAAELFHVDTPERVIFTFNATHGLNIAIRTLVRPGDTVLISGYEHNAVTRPLAAIPGVKVRTAAAPLFRSEHLLDAFCRQLDQDVKAVICTHVSNVFGYILPISGIADICRRQGVPLVVDASQSAGCLPVHMDELGAAFIAMPGHKGLYGPQGTGLLLCGSDRADPVLAGGTGSQSLCRTMPDFLPDRLEAGTHNITGIAGLLEGLRFVRRTGAERILAHERRLLAHAVRGLKAIPALQVFAAGEEGRQSGVCSFRCGAMDCETLGETLGGRGIAVRAGLHCAPLAHETAGTLDTGTVRLSFSVFNTAAEVSGLLREMRCICGRRG